MQLTGRGAEALVAQINAIWLVARRINVCCLINFKRTRRLTSPPPEPWPIQHQHLKHHHQLMVIFVLAGIVLLVPTGTPANLPIYSGCPAPGLLTAGRWLAACCGGRGWALWKTLASCAHTLDGDDEEEAAGARRVLGEIFSAPPPQAFPRTRQRHSISCREKNTRTAGSTPGTTVRIFSLPGDPWSLRASVRRLRCTIRAKAATLRR
jgi:hypothetical protein